MIRSFLFITWLTTIGIHLFRYLLYLNIRRHLGLLWWLSGKESTCQYRRHGFNPWAGKFHWRRKWQPTPVFLPGKSHGQKSLAAYSTHMVTEESDTS